jgi:hypothetical protein
MAATHRPYVSRLPRVLGRGLSDQPLTPEDAASRVAAFVYGDILVLAALIALDPEDLLGFKAVAYVVGTGISTFVAHVLAESVGGRVRTNKGLTGELLRHELRDAIPIISATTLPACLMGVALLGWLNPYTALQLAISVTVLRLAALGWVVGHLRRQRASLRTFLLGMLMALVCSVAAALKWWLTH